MNTSTFCAAVVAIHLFAVPAGAAVVNATYNSPTDVPVTAAGYTATGNTVIFTLNFAPVAGTVLTVVNNTGGEAIQGTFDNLGQWQAVDLTYGGVAYRFVANYFGGTGNDLVLEWANIRLLAWGGGASNYGQLGNGGTTNSSIAVPVDMSGTLAGKTVVRVATGGGFSVALCADGTLATWGDNSNHALGTTGTANSSVPGRVDTSGMPVGKTLISLAAGGSHSFTQCADGTVIGWGSNGSGRLGGMGTGSGWSLPVPVDQTGVLAGMTVTSVAAGGYHSLALCADGTLAAWGSNYNGQLGANSTTDSSVPVLVDRSGVLAGKSVTSIAAGSSHSLVLCSDGTLAAWGYNNSGQLGNNSVTNSPVPVLVQRTGVLSGKSLTAIAGGGGHCMVLCADGTLAAWGDNSSGQLGNGGTTTSRVPVLVTQAGVLAGKTIAAISAGGGYSMAFCTDGTLAAWGYDGYGQLGNNTTTNSNVPVAVTTTILRAGESIVRAVSGNNSQHCLAMVAMPPPPAGSTLAASDIIDSAATLNASVNAQGPATTTVSFEYGLTNSYGSSMAATPGSITGTAATAASTRLAGLASGTTYYFRVVAAGTSGTATGADMTFTTTADGILTGLTPSAGTLFPAFTSGISGYAVAVPYPTSSITITPVCQNTDAVLTVNGSTVASGAASNPLVLTVGDTVINTVVTAGGANTKTYIITVTRLPQTITYNSATDTPVTVTGFVAAGNLPDITLNFAPKAGTVLNVVKNTGMNPIQGAFSNLAQGQSVNLTYGGVSYTFVANYFGGTGNDLVLQWANNRLLAWGSNGSGELGNNTWDDGNVPTPVDMGGALAGKMIIANATGEGHGMALCADGSLAAWGSNGSGQLGNNNTDNSPVPVWVDRSGALAGKTVIAIAAGGSHSLALCSDGTLAAWGNNYYGQLGNHGTVSSGVPVLVDQAGVLAGKTVVAIAAGDITSFALCADGAIAAWGDNTNGRLGNGGSTNAAVPVWVDMSGVLAGKSVVALAAGEYFTVVMCSDGTLATWGDNNFNQLGNNSTANSSVPVLVVRTGVLAGKTPVAICAGERHGMVLCSDAKLYAWGYNQSGQLGNNTTTNSGVPVAVTQTGVLSGKTVISMAAGASHGLALCADGFLAAWGYNGYGQLGVGDTTSRTTPAAVTQSALATEQSITSVNCEFVSSLAMVAMPPAPIATTLAATTVLDTSAILRGSVNANGTSTAISFEYGPTTSYGNTVAATPATASGTTTTAASATISGLCSGTTYHFRIATTGAGGTVKGADMTFTTSALATLSNLSVSGGTLSPAFATTTMGYVTTVPFATTSLTLAPVVANPGGTVTVAGVNVASGSASAPQALATGATRIDVVVTAAGGGNAQTYSVTVTRLPQTITFNSVTDMGVTTTGFAATGNAPPLILNYAPVPGSRLTLVNNTGLGLIAGTFANLAQGQRVQLTCAGITYDFVANYFGGTGNDLVLQWAGTRLLDWGYNNYGQLGNNSTTNSSVPVPVDMGGVLAGKTLIGMATGDYHNLALCSDGTLAAWGYGNYGQLGIGSTINGLVPLAVDLTGVLAGKTIAAIAAGGNHNLALCSDGTLAAWGYNYGGQLGNNSTIGCLVPVVVDRTGVLAGKTVVAIAAGNSHNLALCSDGILVAWGSNYYGQLGNNSVINSGVPVWVDRSGVLAGKTIAAIAVGGSHSLALCSDGSLASWGYNSYGQLGNNSTSNCRVPVLVVQSGVLAGRTVTAIAAGDYHSVCLCADGTVAAWGSNSYGQLGNSTTTSSSIPVATALAGVLAGRTVVALAAGYQHSLAACSDGTLAAWGTNSYGQLGNNSTSYSKVPVTVITTALRTGERFTAADGGVGHSLAIAAAPPVAVATTLAATGILDNAATLNGNVNAQGTTATVTIEYGPTSAYGITLTPTPATVTGATATTASATLTGLPAGSTWHYRVVAAGPGGTTVGQDMAVTTSGYATLSNLTLGGGTLTPAFTSANRNYFVTVASTVGTVTITPVARTLNSTVTVNGVIVASGTPCNPLNLAAGETAIPIVVSAPDGINTLTYTVKVARLPQTFTYNSAADVPLTASDFTATGYAVTVVLNNVPTPGAGLTMVKNTGVASIVGSFSNLAHGQPVTLTYGGINYAYVANYYGGTGNDLVLQWANNRLLSWGNNGSGQLGNHNFTSSSAAVAVDMSGVFASRALMAVAAGSSHCLGLCLDGTLAAWGYNNCGQLGNGSASNSNVPVSVVRTGVLADKTIVAIAAGNCHSLALCADGTLAAWGYNNYGQLGNNTTANSSVPVAVVQTGVLAGRTVVAIAAGSYHNLALCADGTLIAWGMNSNGQLGNATTTNSSVPVLVNQTGVLAGKTVTTLAANGWHNLALCADGTLAAWGSDAYGQLGNNSYTNSNVPVAAILTGVLAGKTVTAHAAGETHSLALCTDGTLAAWGYDNYGQLGNKSTTSSSVPVAVALTGALAGRTAVSGWAGYDHNLALCADGTLAAWGYNSYGQLGNNNTTNSTEPVLVVSSALGAGERFAAAAGGGDFSVAVVAMPPAPAATTLAAQSVTDTLAVLNGSVNGNGSTATVTFEYGLTTTYGTTLGAVPATVDGTTATTASAAVNALLPGTTYHYRVVAKGTGGNAIGNDMTVTMSTTATLSNLTAGGCVLFPEFTSVNTSYLATVPSATDSITVTPVATVPSSTITVNGIAVASGTTSAPINLQPGENQISITVAATGGINTRTYTVKVARMMQSITFNSAATVPMSLSDLAATGTLPIPVLNFTPPVGTVLTVVRNTGGNPIRGTFGNLLQGQRVLLPYNGMTYIFAVNYFGGTGNDLMLQWANTCLVAWGGNSYGQLGNNSTIAKSVAVAVDLSGVLSGKTVVMTANGYHHVLALCADGTLAAWGDNSYGQLGNGTWTSTLVPVLVKMDGVLAGKKVIAIAASGSHSLALCADGTMAEWGSYYTTLPNADSRLPALVDQTGVLAGRTVVAIAAGDNHSVALCADGTLATWGVDANGQLGDNGTVNTSSPVLVSATGVLAGKAVTAIAAGAWHSLALCADGTLVAWGYDNYGQLGNNTTNNSNVPVAVVQTGVLAGKTVTGIAGGGYHSLALCSDGSLASWGYNSNGQLGNNSTTNSSVPVNVMQTDVLLGRTIVGVSCGGYHSLVCCSDGGLATWGYDSSGQLGNNSTTGSSVPIGVSMNALPAGSRVVTAAAGSLHCMAVVALPLGPVVTTLAATDILDSAATLNGSVNANTIDRAVSIEYGLTSSYGTIVAATPGVVSGNTPTTVSAKVNNLLTDATYHYRLTATTGSIMAKGDDMTFTTGVATTLTHLAPDHGTLYPAFSANNASYSVTVPFGTSHIGLTPFAADLTSTITVNGVDVSSGAAAGPFSLLPGENDSVIVVAAADGLQFKIYFVKVIRLPDAFAYHSAADPLIVSDFMATGNAPPLVLNDIPIPGTCWTLVRNIGMAPIHGVFDNLAQGQIMNLTYGGAVYAFVANYHGGTGNDLVLQWANTRLLSWGYDNDGQLGNNSTTNSSIPVPVDVTGALAGKTVLATAAGDSHCLALCADGSLVAWGYNNYGQLGNSGTVTSSTPLPVSMSGALAGKTVVAISAGSSHSLALCSDGTLAAWGYNYYGQLGNGTTTNSSVPVLVAQTGVLAGKEVITIAAGGSHCLVLCSDGTLAAWGYNDSGQLGNGGNVSSSVPVLVNQTGALAGRTVTAIAAAGSHSLALCADGAVAAWGDNSYGQLGNYSTIYSAVPVWVVQSGVLASETVTAIAAGSGHSLALCADGTLAAWGAASSGQLGNNSASNSYVPVRVNQTGALANRMVTTIAAGGGHSLTACADGSPAAWGNNNYGQLGNFSTATSGVPVSVLSDMNGLSADMRFMTVSCGASHSIALAACAMPVATSLPATTITGTSAIMNGKVNASGNATTVSFEYGLTPTYGNTLAASPASTASGSDVDVSAIPGNLLPGTTYHYRVVAASSGVSVRSADMTFTTLSNDALLAALGLNAGTLVPAFDKNVTGYLTTVSNATSAVMATPVTEHPGASVRVNGLPVASGTASAPVNLAAGNTAITAVVTAEDGVTTRSYTITVNRLLPELDDPDQDGIPNLIEQAFGLNPAANSAGQLPQPVISLDRVIIRFNQPAGLSGITYGAQWSGTMQPGSWTDIPDTGAGNEHVFSVPRNAGPNLFMRLKVGGP